MIASQKIHYLKSKYNIDQLEMEYMIEEDKEYDFINDLIELGASLNGIEILEESSNGFLTTHIQEYSNVPYTAYVAAYKFLSTNPHHSALVDFEIYDDYKRAEILEKISSSFEFTSPNLVSVKKEDYRRFLTNCFNFGLFVWESGLVSKDNPIKGIRRAKHFTSLESIEPDSRHTYLFRIELDQL